MQNISYSIVDNLNGILRSVSFKIASLYLFTFCFFALTRHTLLPSLTHLSLQMLTMVVFIILYKFSLRRSVCNQQFFYALFFVIFIEIVVFRLWNIIIYNNSLGYNPIDSLGYDSFARNFTAWRYSLFDILDYLNDSSESIDDYGFNSIICITYKLFGSDIGINALVLFNAIACTWGCILLYRLSYLLSKDKYASRYAALLLNSFTYCVYTAATGLKENFFCLIVIYAMYELIRYSTNSRFSSLVLFLFGAFLCLFFRLAVFFIYIVVLAVTLALKHKIFYQHVKLWSIICGCVGIVLLGLVIDMIANTRGAMAVNQNYVDAIKSGKNLFVYTATNIMTVFTGPIPNFIADTEKQNYITLWNFGAFIRFVLSGYLFYSIYMILKKQLRRYYPLIVFIVLHSIMLVVTMFAIQDRYQMIQLPFVLILIAYGINHLRYASKRVKMLFGPIYMICSTLFVILFNTFKI